MARVNITIPDGLLEEIDRTAADMGETRSGFLQEAGARYITVIVGERERSERSERISRAQDRAREIGERMGPGPDGVTMMRELRDAPPRWMRDKDDGDA